MRILRDFEGFACKKFTHVWKQIMSGLGPFVLKIKKATDVRQWPVIAEDQQVQVQLKKKDCLRSLWSGDIWSTKNLCVFGDAVFTGSSWLFSCNLHSKGSPAVVLVPAWQKLEGYVKDVLAEQMGTSLFFATPRAKDAERRACPTNTHTYTLFSSSFHGRLSPQISFCDPHPTVFLSFCSFLWIQTGFEAKAAFVPSRFVHLPTNFLALTSNFTITLKKYTQIYR